MEEEHNEEQEVTNVSGVDIRTIVQETVQEFVNSEKAKAEPAYKTELAEERKRREQLDRRVNELIAENERSHRMADEAERSATIRDELRRLGVTKVDLGFRAVKDDIYRTEDGRLAARSEDGEVSVQEYLAKFTQENPELLPARIPGGSGAAKSQERDRPGGIDLASIKPGMDPEELDRIRREIAQAVSHTISNT